MTYKTKGVCTREITFEVKDNKLMNVVLSAAVLEIPRASPGWWRE